MQTLLFIFVLFSSCQSEYYVSTFAGGSIAGYTDGPGKKAYFNYPSGVVADAFGNVFVADSDNHMIRKINSTGYVSTVAGSGTAAYSDGQSVQASFNGPSDMAIDLSGNIFLSDSGNNMIRMINTTGYVTTVAGNGSALFSDGQGMDAAFCSPYRLTIDKTGNIIVSDRNRIRKINSTGFVDNIAGSDNNSFSDGQGIEGTFFVPSGLAIDFIGNIFVCDGGNARIRKINSTGYVSTIAGSGNPTFSDGQGTEASFFGPNGITIDSNDNLYVADSINQRIRKIDSSGYVTTIAGTGNSGNTDGEGSMAAFKAPAGITIDANGTIFVADYMNNKIRKIISSSSVSCTTISGSSSLISPIVSSITSTPVETNTISAPSSIVTTTFKTKIMSPILAAYLKPEFLYSVFIGMFFVALIAIFYFIVTIKMKPKLTGRRERFIRNMEFQRKLELKQRQQSLPRTRFKDILNQK